MNEGAKGRRSVETALGFAGTVADSREGALDGVCCSDVFPVFGWEVIKGQEHIAVLDQFADGLVVFHAIHRGKYHTDHQGSIRQVTDAAGTVVNQYTYDSYGQFIERVETVAQLYGYTAREQDAESPLYYYRSRYYDPRTGRFTQEDRIGFDGGDVNI